MSERSPRVESWCRSVLELSADHPLLHLRESKLLVPLPGADPARLAQTIAGGGAYAFEAGADGALEQGWLRVPVTTPELDRRLTAMRRAAQASRADRGAHVLWLALGALTWMDAEGSAHAAPLALWPVELERGPRLVAAEGMTPQLNHVLVEKLARDFGIALAVPGDDDPEVSLDLEGLFDAAEGIAVTRPGWKVERVAHLGVLALDAIAVWRDLMELPAEPVLAAGPLPAGAPAHLIAPLDADASQLAAIHAAAQGASFILHAAPGTGATQTIANLIAHCIATGKTVLYVGDQLRSLDGVHQRLAGVGLGEFCLPIAAPEATRAAVVGQLGRVFDRAFRPGTGPTGDDARLGQLRAALDTYVAALHRVGPFGRSVHDVLGRLVELRTTPRAELAERDAIALDRATFERRRAAVTALANAALPVEPVGTHPWRASTLDRMPPGGEAEAIAALEEVAAAAGALADCVRDLCAVVPNLAATSRDQLLALGALAAAAAASPRPGAEMLTHIKSGRGADVSEAIALIRARGQGGVETPRDPIVFLQLAHKHRALALEVNDVFTDAVAELDAPSLWAQLRKWTSSMAALRYVALRTARAQVKAAAMPGMLESDDAMITALEAVIAERACRSALLGAAEPAARWFGELGGDPLALDLTKLDAAVGWAAELRKAFDAVEIVDARPRPSEASRSLASDAVRAAAWRALVAQVAAGPAASAADLAPFERLAAAVARWVPALAALANVIGIDQALLGAGEDHLAALRERVEGLSLAAGSLAQWVAFHAARHGARAAGIDHAIGAIERGDLGAGELAAAWERATLLAWGDAELTEAPALAQFHGATHDAQVAAFADLDRGALALSRARALVKIAERVPRVLGKLDPNATDPLLVELGVLQSELKQPKRGLRALFAALPNLLPRLAPCLLMTPQTVARYLDPSLARFDVVVIDDAGQLPMAAAAGAIGRADAAVFVGDAARLGPAGSALDEALAAKLPELSLAWHYRSKHEDVFAFAAQRHYPGVQVFAAAGNSPELGVAWRRIDGIDDGTNRAEADAVVAEILARLRDPVQRMRSLGVVTCSAAQAELIEDLLDAALLGEPPAVLGAAAEPIVVRDATAFRDDRDVILWSVGFAPGPDGVMSMALGPLALPTGGRALATILTRAREQLVVFSSFAPEDLHDDAAPAVRELADLVTFARAGGGAARTDTDTAPASPITAAMGRALSDRGWTVRHQVGVGGFKVDLAVVDPGDPERYVLGIEADGAAYATGATARDRDRLRTQLLAGLGWRLHRVWGLDWWAEPEREIQRAHGAIVTAIAATRQRRAPARESLSPKPRAARGSGQQAVIKIPPRTEPSAATSSASSPNLAAGSGPTEATPLAAYDGATTPTRIARGMIAIGPYTAAAIPAGRRTPDDLFAARHLAELGKVIEQVLAAEAPMHVELLARRVGGYFGIGRVTQRVIDQVGVALVGRGRRAADGVVWRLDQDPDGVPAVRVAGHTAAARRAITEVPLPELASAARIVVERAHSVAPTDLVRDTARLLGFARITDEVIARVTLAVSLATARELIKIENGKAQLPKD